ncbi:MAG: hypothetical protein WKF86_05375, partial [Acidimicrobiales bacterium]
MRRVVLSLLAALFVAAGCTSSGVVGAGPIPVPPGAPPSSSVPSAPAPAQLAWQPCAELECATLQVPLDHADPAGRKIEIALNRKKAGDPSRRIGSLLINPGGPGGSGITSLPLILGRLSSEVKARFDVVGFDPRGVGMSTP